MIREEDLHHSLDVSAPKARKLNDDIDRKALAQYKISRHKNFETFVANNLFASPTLFNSKKRIPGSSRNINPIVSFYSTVKPLRAVDDEGR